MLMPKPRRLALWPFVFRDAAKNEVLFGRRDCVDALAAVAAEAAASAEAGASAAAAAAAAGEDFVERPPTDEAEHARLGMPARELYQWLITQRRDA